MASLTPAELRGRLALDYRAIRKMRGDLIAGVRAFANESAARSGREVSEEEGRAGRAAVYEVDYGFPIPVGPGRTVPRAVALVDLLAGGSYPYSRPLVTFTSRPLPWTPHVHPATGIVCLGNGWTASRGCMLAGALIGQHLPRLINFDEPDQPGYDGWNSAAIDHWRKLLNCRPWTQDLAYAVLPADVTHGLPPMDAGFRSVLDILAEPFFRAAEQDAFRPAIESPGAFFEQAPTALMDLS